MSHPLPAMQNANPNASPSNSDYKESIMETTLILGLYRDSIGIMEKKMETTVVYGLGGPRTQ